MIGCGLSTTCNSTTAKKTRHKDVKLKPHNVNFVNFEIYLAHAFVDVGARCATSLDPYAAYLHSRFWVEAAWVFYIGFGEPEPFENQDPRS